MILIGITVVEPNASICMLQSVSNAISVCHFYQKYKDDQHNIPMESCLKLLIMVALYETENDHYILRRVFPNTVSPPSLYRFSRNFATQRRFIGNRKLHPLYI